MLMPPQQSPAPPPITPGPGGNLDPNYGFIFNGQQQPPQKKFGLPLPRFGGSKRPLILVLIVAIALIILIPVLSGIFIRSGVNSKELIDVVAHAREINRVSAIVEQKSADQNTKNLAATTQVALVSEETEMLKYLGSVKVKVGVKNVQTYFDNNATNEIQTSIQNNNLSTTYGTYLKNEIGKYQNAVKTADLKAPKKAHAILQEISTSNQFILTSQQVASSTNP
jgi:hypothetical protein